MEIIKFDLNELEKVGTGFNYYLLGRSYDLEENDVEQDYNKALYYYQKGFDLDYPLCIYSLGISYELGLGKILEVDKEKAKKLLTNAYPKIIELINNPNIPEIERVYAKFVTGAYYYFGLGEIEKDYSKAFEIIKECADKGHIAAIYDLGANFYFNGNGTDINYELTDYYLNIAKENGLKRARDLFDLRNKMKK
jgi:TPR repeat protein